MRETSRGTVLTRLTPAYPAAALFLLVGAPPVGHPPADLPEVAREASSSAASELFATTPEPEALFLSGGGAMAGLRAGVDGLLGSAAWRTGQWGVLAVSLATGDTLLSVDPEAPLVPASNLKIATSAAALHHLGPHFRFSTFLLVDGAVSDGVLHGDLILYGTGDPSLSDGSGREAASPFPAFLAELRENGIREIRGDIVGDESHFEGPFRRDGWNWRSLNDWYAARASALSFNQNVALLRIQAGPAGSPARVATVPEAANLPIDNQSVSVTGRPTRSFMAIRDDPETPIVLWGQLTAGSRELQRVITVSDPPLYAASVFRGYLEDHGIRVTGGVRAVRSRDESRAPRGAVMPAATRREDARPSVRTLAVHRSPPVSELLRRVNVESHNLYAELLAFTIGRVVTGTGSFAAGTEVIERFLVEVVGVPPDQASLDDGSGLSRENRLSAASLVRVLEHMAESEHADVFWESLPVAGDRRGIPRMYRTPAAGNLRAKTGTIQRVSSLSGVVTTYDGEPVAFSFLANGMPSSAAKRIEDQIAVRLASFSRGTRLVEDGREDRPPIVIR